MHNKFYVFSSALIISILLVACSTKPNNKGISETEYESSINKEFSCFKQSDIYMRLAHSYISKINLQKLHHSINNLSNLSQKDKYLYKTIANRIYQDAPENNLSYSESRYLACQHRKYKDYSEPKSIKQCLLFVNIAHATRNMKKGGLTKSQIKDKLNLIVYGKKTIELRNSMGLLSDIDIIVKKAYDDEIAFSLYTDRLFHSCLSIANTIHEKGRVVKVYSGDHFRVRLEKGNTEFNTYLMGFRAPKHTEPGFKAAKDAFSKLTSNKSYLIDYFKHPNGYYISSLSSRGQNVDSKMFKSGYGEQTKRDMGPGTSIRQSAMELSLLLSKPRKNPHGDMNETPVLWNKVKYGMSTTRVLSIVKDSKKNTSYKKLANGALNKISKDSTTILGHTAEAQFYFINEKLEQIIFNLKHNSSRSDHKANYKSLFHRLQSKYGRDDISGHSRSSQMTVDSAAWKVGDIDITLTAFGSKNNIFIIILTYQKHNRERTRQLKKAFGSF